VAVTSDGKQAISGSWDNTLKVWNLNRARKQDIPTKHRNLVGTVAVTPDGKQVISGSGKPLLGSADKTLKIWDIETGTRTITLTGSRNHIKAVTMTPNCKWVISGLEERAINVWNLELARNTLPLQAMLTR
jgi:WD40 repeat protein